MSYKSVAVLLGTSDTDIFLMPATFSGAMKVSIANISGIARTYTIKHYKASTAATTTIAAAVSLLANSEVKSVVPVTLEAGDKIIGSADVASAVAVTCAISIGPTTARIGLTPRGDYSAGTTYAKNDIVNRPSIGSFLSIQDANFANTPESSAAYWMSLAAKGDTGLTGVAGGSSLMRCRVIAIGSENYATDFENGDTVDGVVLVTGDIVGRASASAPERNGVWIVQVSGAAVRHGDFDTYDEYPGSYFSVSEGTANADTLWQCTSNRGGTLNTTAITIVKALDLTSIALTGLTGAADKIPYFTGADTAALADFTAAGRALVDDPTVSAQRVTLGVVGRTMVGNANATLTAGDLPLVNLIAALSAPRTWTLPLANSVENGRTVTIADTGGITSTNTLTIQRQGADTVVGLGVSGNAFVLNALHSSVTFVSDGISNWIRIANALDAGLGSGVATFLGTPSSANLAAAVTGETGTGALVFGDSPALVTPALGTPSTLILTNATGLPTAGLVNDAVTYAKIQNVSATDKLLGRSTAGAGDVEEVACTAFGRSLIDDANAAAGRTTLGLGTNVINATYDLSTASGNQDITGFGFDPKGVSIIFGVNGGSVLGVGFAASVSGTPGGAWTFSDSSLTSIHDTTHAIVYTNSAGTSAQVGIVSFITDGIRIAWTKTGSPTGTLTITVKGDVG